MYYGDENTVIVVEPSTNSFIAYIKGYKSMYADADTKNEAIVNLIKKYPTNFKVSIEEN